MASYGPDVVSQVIDELGIEVLSVHGDWGHACCPLHEDESPSFTINLREGGWKCYAGCGSSRDLANLIHERTDEPLADIRRRLRQRMPKDNAALLKALEEIDDQAAQEEREKAPLYYEHGVAHRYILDRGFTVDTLKAWDIGWDSKSASIVIPATENGELVGLIRRKLNWKKGDGAKYKNSDGFLPSERGHLFGLDHVPADCFWVVIVEGPLDAIWLWQLGVPAVALLGSSASPQQIDAIRRRFWRVVIATDDDKAGNKAYADLRKQLADLHVQRFPIERGKNDVQESGPEYILPAIQTLPAIPVY